ncbi:MAG: hypothetical protein LQ352_006126, partial [Teloschistes flavicans]
SGAFDFLRQDAATTRRSFATWLHTIFFQSPLGNSLPKRFKAQIQSLCRPLGEVPVTRDLLAPEILHILETWERIPLKEGSAEWSKARVRLVRDLILDGKFQACQAQGLGATQTELAEARCWLHKTSEGQIEKYHPLRQPWYHKDLEWDQRIGQLKTVVANPALSNETPSDSNQDPERVRISHLTFQELISNRDGSVRQQIEHSPQEPNPETGRGQSGESETAIHDDELLDVSEAESDSQAGVRLDQIPWYLGQGTVDDPFLVERFDDTPAYEDQIGLGEVQDKGEDSASGDTAHGSHRTPSVAVSEASTEMESGRTKQEVEESDKENAAKNIIYRRDTPSIRQNITSADFISPIEAPGVGAEMHDGGTSPDPHDLLRAGKAPHLPYYSLSPAIIGREQAATPSAFDPQDYWTDNRGGRPDLADLFRAAGDPRAQQHDWNQPAPRARKRAPTPFAHPHESSASTMMDVHHGSNPLQDNDERMQEEDEEEEDDGVEIAVAPSIKRALSANAAGHQPNIPGGNKRRRI